MTHTVESLIAFRDRVRDAFLAKQIRCPVHLPGGNERQLIDIFQQIKPNDWKCSNWRNMYHALLSGIPEDSLFDMICNGRSMFVMSKEHRFLSSSIVAGMLPIACGLAMGIKRLKDRASVTGWHAITEHKLYAKSGGERVFVFIGDMTSRCGLFHEFREYCGRHDLPVHIVIEDNGYSTNTPTAAAWGDKYPREAETWVSTTRYSYDRTTPHVGVGQHVEF